MLKAWDIGVQWVGRFDKDTRIGGEIPLDERLKAPYSALEAHAMQAPTKFTLFIVFIYFIPSSFTMFSSSF